MELGEGALREWQRLVAEAWSAEAELWTRDGISLRRVPGGANNALYQLESDGRLYAIKLCVQDERHRATREYNVMRLLQTVGLDIAPEPIGLDESCTIAAFPTVIYRWLPGEPLGSYPTRSQLAALLQAFQLTHSLNPTDDAGGTVPDAWFHWFDFRPYLEEVDEFLNLYGSWLATTGEQGVSFYDRLARLVGGCSEALLSAQVDVHRESIPLRLCRVDLNLANAIWGSDGQVRWVDWEFCGWGDPALDLAELRWHAALEGLSEDQHAWLRDNYRRPADDVGFERRLELWDRLISTRWPFLVLRWLWSRENGPDRQRLGQFVRDPSEMFARMVCYIERAEWVACTHGG